MNKRIVVVSGASKGIGLAFVKYHLMSPVPTTVYALSRSRSHEIDILSKQYAQSPSSQIHHVPCDLIDDNSIFNAVNVIKEQCRKDDEKLGIDLLVNVAGILGNNTTEQPGPERSIGSIQRNWMKTSFEINLFGHIMLTQQLIPLLKISKERAMRISNDLPKVVNISARVGSIEDNRLGGWYSYRMSKAALNMFSKTLSIELKRHNCIVVSMHPGTTNTDLSMPFQKNVKREKLFTTEYSVAKMMDVIKVIGLNDTGKCFSYDGTIIPP